MQRGNLIIYDNEGKIWSQTGEAEGDVLPHTYPAGLPCIELPFGSTQGKIIKSVNVSKEVHEVILEDIPVVKTEEQIRIEELETQLLLAEGVI